MMRGKLQKNLTFILLYTKQIFMTDYAVKNKIK